MKPVIWHNCYDSSWKGLIVPEAFAHPAKFARGLIERIVRHGLARGWWKAGETVGDPFGGVALGGIVCGYHGLNWVGVELEEKFVGLGNRNLSLHGPRWMALDGGASRLVLRQGDSRRFADEARPAGIITSPPYISGGHHADQTGAWNANGRGQGMTRDEANYGPAEGQIGQLAPGDLAAVLTSPPYEDSPVGGYGPNSGGMGETHRNDGKTIRQRNGGLLPGEQYGGTDGQIGLEAGETYWAAMKAVYSQCRLALRPGGHMAVVVKDYVKDKQRVPLSDQTLELLTHLGFEPVERIHAMLVKERRHAGLFAEVVERTERKSFFRRLAEKKGSPAIDHEDVLIVRAPAPHDYSPEAPVGDDLRFCYLAHGPSLADAGAGGKGRANKGGKR